VDHPQNQHVTVLDAIDDNVLADGKTPQADAKIVVATAPQVRMAGEQKETTSDRIDQTVGDLDACAFGGDVIPDFV
jgi:hypothetical protein